MRRVLQNIGDSYKDNTSKLSEEKRQRPFNIDEAFRSDVNNSLFDVERIYQQIDFNNSSNPVTVYGDFVWKGGIEDSEVIWQPRKNGKFHIAWIPPNERRNKKDTKNGRLYPGNHVELVAGCDPYDHDTTTDGRRSDAAAYVYKKFSMMDDFSSFCMYIHRPPKADIFMKI